MENRNGGQKRRSPIQRILALAGVALLLFLVVCTLFFAITGNPNFFGMLLLTMMAPILLWIYMFIYKLLRGKGQEEPGGEKTEGQRGIEEQKDGKPGSEERREKDWKI